MLPKKKSFTGWFCSAQTFQIVIQVKSRDKLLTIVWLGNSLCSFLHRSLHHWIVMFIFVSLILWFTKLYIYTIDYILYTTYHLLYTIYYTLSTIYYMGMGPWTYDITISLGSGPRTNTSSHRHPAPPPLRPFGKNLGFA